MRVLVDECLPRRLAAALAGMEATTVPDAGWSGRSNGELLDLAEGQFDAFLTIDRSLEHQQPLHGRRLSVIVIAARSNTFEAVSPMLPDIVKALREIGPGDVLRVGV